MSLHPPSSAPSISPRPRLAPARGRPDGVRVVRRPRPAAGGHGRDVLRHARPRARCAINLDGGEVGVETSTSRASTSS